MVISRFVIKSSKHMHSATLKGHTSSSAACFKWHYVLYNGVGILPHYGLNPDSCVIRTDDGGADLMQQLLQAHGEHTTSRPSGPGSTIVHQQDADHAVSSPPDHGPESPRSDTGPNSSMHRLQDPQSAEIVQEWQEYLAGQRPQGPSTDDRFA